MLDRFILYSRRYGNTSKRIFPSDFWYLFDMTSIFMVIHEYLVKHTTRVFLQFEKLTKLESVSIYCQNVIGILEVIPVYIIGNQSQLVISSPLSN